MGGVTISDVDNPEGTPSNRTGRKRANAAKGARIFVAVLLLTAIAGLAPLTAWQRREQRDAVSINTLRRLGQGLLLYSQDWDDRPMPPVLTLKTSGETHYQTWPQTLLPYLPDKNSLDNPANPLAKSTNDPTGKYEITSAYALNSRFYNTFGPGTYPLDDLELPYRTVLFIEAGPAQSDPLRPDSSAHFALARLDYGDISDTVNERFFYPSPHNGKIILVAADGHAETVTVAHYRPTDGPHDKLYGRIGGNVYNWNGGFATGETDKPARE